MKFALLVMCFVTHLRTMVSFEIVYNVCINTTASAVVYGKPLLVCAHICNDATWCQFVRFNVKLRVCSLYNTTVDLSITDCIGYSGISKNEAVKMIHSINCENCLNYPTLCQNYSDSVTKLLGNTNDIASRRVLVCDSGLTVDGQSYSECTTSGDWSEHGTCRKTCPEFSMNIPKLTVVGINIPTAAGVLTFPSVSSTSMVSPNFTGTIVTFACLDGYPLKGDNSSVCLDGEWTSFPYCGQRMREPCLNSSECSDSGAECRNSQCWCPAGQSHDPCSHSCVPICPGAYGNTFQDVLDYGIKGYNRKIVPVSDIEACKQLCLNHTDNAYTCKYVDWGFGNNKCYLNEIPDDSAPVMTYFPGDAYFQRDCATC